MFKLSLRGREANSIILQCWENDWEYYFNDIPLKDHIPVGSVEFVEQLIGARKPHYYPEWAKPIIRRKLSNKFFGEICFVKPNDRYKAFDGFITDVPYEYEGDLVYSEVVNFIDEWRIYVVNGEKICSWWYKGNEETSNKNPNGPELDLDIPENFTGTIDVGLTKEYNGLELVECHEPYAIGWYGEYEGHYAQFLIEGYKHLIK